MPVAAAPSIENTRNGVPDLASTVGPPSRSVPIWAVVIAAVLLVGAIVAGLVVALGSGDPSDDTDGRKADSEEISNAEPTVPLAVRGATSLVLSRTSPEQVTVSWIQAAGLSFRWQRCDPGVDQGPQERPGDAASEPDATDPESTRWTMTLQAPTGTYPCVRLFVVDGTGDESDGAEAQLAPDPTAAPPP